MGHQRRGRTEAGSASRTCVLNIGSPVLLVSSTGRPLRACFKAVVQAAAPFTPATTTLQPSLCVASASTPGIWDPAQSMRSGISSGGGGWPRPSARRGRNGRHSVAVPQASSNALSRPGVGPGVLEARSVNNHATSRPCAMHTSARTGRGTLGTSSPRGRRPAGSRRHRVSGKIDPSAARAIFCNRPPRPAKTTVPPAAMKGRSRAVKSASSMCSIVSSTSNIGASSHAASGSSIVTICQPTDRSEQALTARMNVPGSGGGGASGSATSRQAASGTRPRCRSNSPKHNWRRPDVPRTFLETADFVAVLFLSSLWQACSAASRNQSRPARWRRPVAMAVRSRA